MARRRSAGLRWVVPVGAAVVVLLAARACHESVIKVGRDETGDQASEEKMEDNSAPGWNAIDAALNQLYGDLEPIHYGTVKRYAAGGPDPLDGISFFPVEEPAPHWHAVTYGLTELYAKESPAADVSGFGFELTLRLTREEGDEEPPAFVWNFLQTLARYLFDSGSRVGHGHLMDLNGPLAASRDTRITAIGFAPDPMLPALETPHGRVEFLQVLGLTGDELMAARAWDKPSFFRVLARRYPTWIIDLDRDSILEDEAIRREVERLSKEEGSSTDSISVSRQEVVAEGGTKIRWTLGALVVDPLRKILPGRVPFGRSLELRGAGTVVVLEPGRTNRAAIGEDGGLTLTLTSDAAFALVELLEGRAGEYRLHALPGVVIEVVPTEIRNSHGEVVEVIG